jgi:hypothetical protein
MPTFDATGPVLATIDVVVGDVRIIAGDDPRVGVEVRPADASNADDVKAAEQTRVELANEQLHVRAPKPRSWLPRGPGGSIEVQIELPAGSRLRATGQLTDFAADGRLGRCRIKTGVGSIVLDDVETPELKTGIGDITVERASGHAEVTAGSGDVRIRELAASGVVKNSNGDTWIGVATGDLRVSAANGGIAVDRSEASVVAKSSNGDVRLSAVTRGRVVLETSLGDLEVGIPEGTAAWLDARAVAGRVVNELEASDAPANKAETVEVRARTTAGNVLVRRP